MRYAYPCSIVRDEEEARATGREAYAVTFPDVYGANTGGWSWDEAMEIAEDCLRVALGMYVKAREDIPEPAPPAEDQVLVSVSPIVAAKLALYTAMREQDVTNVALARRLGLQENAVRRLVDPDHRSHITSVEKALKELGRSLLVEDRVAARIP
ncbi:MAG: hypothetical protein F4Y98_06710 [Chloroflexi bacterium]|nr:hypothetical protein [Chloroflexota bacterium]